MLGDFRRTSSACSVNWCTQSWESKVSWRGWFFFLSGSCSLIPMSKDTSSRLVGVIRMKCSSQASTSLQRRFWATHVSHSLTCLDATKSVLSSVFILIVCLKVDKLQKSFFFLYSAVSSWIIFFFFFAVIENGVFFFFFFYFAGWSWYFNCK